MVRLFWQQSVLPLSVQMTDAQPMLVGRDTPNAFYAWSIQTVNQDSMRLQARVAHSMLPSLPHPGCVPAQDHVMFTSSAWAPSNPCRGAKINPVPWRAPGTR